MANVTIYPVHKEVLDGLISSAKVGSQLGATATGPFKDQRDAYVFAASIGIALGKPALESELPTTKGRETISIRDSVLLGADGARELSIAALLLQDIDSSDDTDTGLRRQLDEIADGDLTKRFALLDRYAFAGFSWLLKYMKDAGTIRELVMEAIDKVVSVDLVVDDYLVGSDPLGGFLL
jgi:hypothetical protein